MTKVKVNQDGSVTKVELSAEEKIFFWVSASLIVFCSFMYFTQNKIDTELLYNMQLISILLMILWLGILIYVVVKELKVRKQKKE